MIGFVVRVRVRIKIRIRVRVRVGVTFNVGVYRWSNCLRSKCRTLIKIKSKYEGQNKTHNQKERK